MTSKKPGVDGGLQKQASASAALDTLSRLAYRVPKRPIQSGRVVPEVPSKASQPPFDKLNTGNQEATAKQAGNSRPRSAYGRLSALASARVSAVGSARSPSASLGANQQPSEFCRGDDQDVGTSRRPILNGLNTYKFASGAIYEGEFVNGEMHGQGAFRWPDGRMYSGGLAHNRRTGQGTLRYVDGSKYEGAWLDDAKCGQGQQMWRDGALYIGQWEANTRHGQGTLTTAQGDRYEGQWRKDQPEGSGRLRTRDGARYSGAWRAGKPSGEGSMNFADGMWYMGNWLNGLPNGFGGMNDPYGARYEGEFVDGKPSHLGWFTTKEGGMYSGTWVDGCWKSHESFAASAELQQPKPNPSLDEVLANPARRAFLVSFAKRTLRTETLFCLLRLEAFCARGLQAGTESFVAESMDVAGNLVSEGVGLQNSMDSRLCAHAMAGASAGAEDWCAPVLAEVRKGVTYQLWADFTLNTPEYEQMLKVPPGTPPGGDHFMVGNVHLQSLASVFQNLESPGC